MSHTLSTVPDRDWDEIAFEGVDVVWLMGVWERSPAGAAVARKEEWLRHFGQTYFSDFSADDIVGSPYCVHQYVPDEHLGGVDGLKVAREQLRTRGVGLILDYVPNHVSIDHPWVREQPGYLVAGTELDLAARPTEFVRTESGVFANARDPYFPPWTDVLQLNTFRPEVRRAAVATLHSIGSMCDGVRCDMAMLVMNDVFARTWGDRAGPSPVGDYWPEVVGDVKSVHPQMTFIAEAYWDREAALLEQGFDYCYDKRLYDRLVQREPLGVRAHLRADVGYQRRLVRFIENHDEPRAAAVFSPAAARAAAVTVATVPGATLFHDGQLGGRRLRVPVALRRRPHEEENPAFQAFYRRLVAVAAGVRQGEWQLCEISGWPDNQSAERLVAWRWVGESTHIVVVNLAPEPAQGRVHLAGTLLGSPVTVLRDVLSGDVFERDTEELCDDGLYVELDAYAFHVLHVLHAG